MTKRNIHWGHCWFISALGANRVTKITHFFLVLALFLYQVFFIWDGKGRTDGKKIAHDDYDNDNHNEIGVTTVCICRKDSGGLCSGPRSLYAVDETPK